MPDHATPRLNLPLLAAGQAQKEITHNEALALVEAALVPCAEAIGLDAPPASPQPGQCWIVGGAPTGLWIDRGEELALWTEGGWRFLPATEGLRVWIKPDQLWALYTDGAWVIGDERVSRLLVAGLPIVQARQPAVPLPTGGTVIDLEARAALAMLIGRLTAHGLIAA